MTSEQKQSYAAIIGRCFINAPFAQLQQGLLAVFLEHRLQPEIGLEGDCLWTEKDSSFIAIARQFSAMGLDCTLHAPFFDLNPGAVDREILRVTRQKLHRAFSLIDIFRPRSIVCHLGYDDCRYGANPEEWLAISGETWTELLEIADRTATPVMFENTYEKKPEIHRRLFTGLESSNFGFCLDVGHLMAFANSTWQVWLEALQPWLGQLHLHDNRGDRDEHIAIGHGKFDFQGLFAHLRRNSLTPLITLEPHSEKDLWDSLEMIRTLGLF